jgi:precorrin-6B methylase 2
MPDIVINLLIVFCVLSVVFLVVTAVAYIFIAVPFIPTSRKVINEIIKFSDLEDGDFFYDIGAGDGRVLIAAKKKFPSINVIGIEFVPTIWLIGKLRILFSGVNVKFFCGDALKHDLSNANCIFLYLIPSIMEKLEEKFDKELKPGTRVISYAFYFSNRKPIKEIPVPWISGERKLRMYHWCASDNPKHQQ